MRQSVRDRLVGVPASKVVIVALSIVVVGVVLGLMLRAGSGDQSDQANSYSAEVPIEAASTSPGALAAAPVADSTTTTSGGIGLAGAVAGFGLMGVWLLMGVAMLVRGKRAKPEGIEPTG